MKVAQSRRPAWFRGMRFREMSGCMAAVTTIFFAGCQQEEIPPPSPPEVTVTTPVQQEVTDYTDYTGTLRAVESVDIRARVQGFLKSVNYVDGTMAGEGDLLFVIEPEPFQAELDAANAKLKETEARLKLAEANLGRAQTLYEKKTISREEFQAKWAERDQAAAEILGDRAAIEQAQINLSYTQIHAPFAGLVGRHLVDPGNLVGAGEKTLLTTIVKMDPMYAYFDVTENAVIDVLRWRRDHPDAAAGKENEGNNERLQVRLGLAGEEGFPHEGYLDYMDNQVDPTTGTAVVRGIFENKEGYLYPGLYARIRIPLAPVEDALLVHERALGTDLAGKYLLVVDDKNIVEQRHVELGSLFGEMRLIKKGIAPGERYIVKGLQRARPGLPVTPKMEETTPPAPQADAPPSDEKPPESPEDARSQPREAPPKGS